MEAIVIEELSVVVRRVQMDDAEEIAKLSGQLGYEASTEEISERIEKLSGCGESQAVFVACLRTDGADKLVGWIDVAITLHLQSPPFVLIGGLVVQEDLRGLGIGRRLCEEAENWTRARGISTMRVTSRSTRADAHRFYERDGFKEIKTSKVFEKVLD